MTRSDSSPPRAKKRFGQHFLSDPRILGRIADAVDAGAGDTVLEIGPGRGALTGELVKRAGRLIAIERDADLIADLRERFPRAEIVEGDALELDWHALTGGAGTIRIAGNIPYNITSPLIDKALEPPRPAVVVYLVQKEVAERLAAPADSKAYGALTVGVQAVSRVEKLFVVPAGAFHPRPLVDSALIRLTPLAEPLVEDAGIPSFRRLVVGLFGLRRKQLVRGLRELTGWPVERVMPILNATALDPIARPETVDPAAFARLWRAVVDAGWTAQVPL